ncbi:MAG: DUF421 domain-containing protein [Solirubrobacteraceae bacterium]
MWHNIFALGVGAGEKVIRSVLIYLFLLVAFRLFGKRELGQASTLDLTVLVLVANAVQNGIIGNDVSVTGAIIGAVVLFGMNAAFARAAFHIQWMSWLLEGSPSTLISECQIDRRALRREQISLPELRAIARRQGFADLGEVYTAVLETNGVVSMFHQDEGCRYHPEATPHGLRFGKHRGQAATRVS